MKIEKESLVNFSMQHTGGYKDIHSYFYLETTKGWLKQMLTLAIFLLSMAISTLLLIFHSNEFEL
jgi:hypothetical protein